MNRLGERLLDLLYPPKCAFCRKLVSDGRMLCPDCESRLPVPEKEKQSRKISGLAVCLSPLYYTGDVRQSLHRYKFQGAAAYYRIYAELMAACVREHGLTADLVTWVPLSRKRLRRRGYDQARLLAEEVAGRLALPCEQTLEKIRNNPAQSGTSGAEERQKNVLGVYRAVTSFAGEHVLLVDDIVTTGATLSEAAKELLNAGAEQVSGLTLARTDRENNGFRTEANGESDYADI
jgi:ComF family protein